MPSCAFIEAWLRPPIWACNLVEMARPAASSAELLIRKPEDRRCIDLLRSLPALKRARCALRELTLVRIDIAMTDTPFGFQNLWLLAYAEVSSRGSSPIRGNLNYVS